MARRNLQHVCLGRTRQEEEFKADIVRAHEGETPVSRAAAEVEAAVYEDIKLFTEACLRPNNLRPPNSLELSLSRSYIRRLSPLE